MVLVKSVIAHPTRHRVAVRALVAAAPTRGFSCARRKAFVGYGSTATEVHQRHSRTQLRSSILRMPFLRLSSRDGGKPPRLENVLPVGEWLCGGRHRASLRRSRRELPSWFTRTSTIRRRRREDRRYDAWLLRNHARGELPRYRRLGADHQQATLNRRSSNHRR